MTTTLSPICPQYIFKDVQVTISKDRNFNWICILTLFGLNSFRLYVNTMSEASKNCCPSTLPPVTTSDYSPKGHYEEISELKTCKYPSPCWSRPEPNLLITYSRHHGLADSQSRHHPHLRCLRRHAPNTPRHRPSSSQPECYCISSWFSQGLVCSSSMVLWRAHGWGDEEGVWGLYELDGAPEPCGSFAAGYTSCEGEISRDKRLGLLWFVLGWKSMLH